MSRLPIRAAALAAAAARASYAGLRQRPPGGTATWSRTNHRGEPVTLLEGPAVAAGAVAGALAAPGLTARGRAALAVAGAGAAALGCYDDLAGSGSSRGFRGHLGALRRGELTTGAVKIAGIGATGVAASALLGAAGAGRRRDRGRAPAALAAADLAINAGLIAGGANLLNLFDLRPGRAIKVTLGAGTLLAASSPAGRAAVAAPLGAATALLGEDLGERAMLGDGGANALGAMLGTAAAAALPRPARLATLAAIIGLTGASEVVSFTKVIQKTPALNWLDMLGRRPPAPAASTGAPGSAGSGSAAAGPQASQNGSAVAGAASGAAAAGATAGAAPVSGTPDGTPVVGDGVAGDGAAGGAGQEPAAPAASAPQ
jgi:hypothetical protein